MRVCRDDNSASYQFRCPSCGSQVVRPAEPRVVEMLVASGVTLTTWSWPRELAEVHSGPPIDHDDLLDFHRLLQTDGWLETLSRTIRQ